MTSHPTIRIGAAARTLRMGRDELRDEVSRGRVRAARDGKNHLRFCALEVAALAQRRRREFTEADLAALAARMPGEAHA